MLQTFSWFALVQQYAWLINRSSDFEVKFNDVIARTSAVVCNDFAFKAALRSIMTASQPIPSWLQESPDLTGYPAIFCHFVISFSAGKPASFAGFSQYQTVSNELGKSVLVGTSDATLALDEDATSNRSGTFHEREVRAEYVEKCQCTQRPTVPVAQSIGQP